MSYVVYIICCSDGYLYTGITGNLLARMEEHINGKSRHTRNRLPLRLIYLEKFSSRAQAAKREQEIKGWGRRKELELMENSLR